jgi:ssDNA-binding Zn-finger/Zn-ribbon topoisomerase 1
MQQVLKGVVVRLPAEAQPGLIKCGRGKDFSFSAAVCVPGYIPLARDVVAVTEENGELSAVRLYHREGFVPQKEAAADLRIKCPRCGKKMMPKARFENGQIAETECPHCHEILERMEPRPASRKAKYLQWGLLAVGAVCLLLAAFLNQ